jgi:hypothetical protein
MSFDATEGIANGTDAVERPPTHGVVIPQLAAMASCSKDVVYTHCKAKDILA